MLEQQHYGQTILRALSTHERCCQIVRKLGTHKDFFVFFNEVYYDSLELLFHCF